MSKPSREIEVPKIASQSGNPGLYEVLKDIVKRASAYINELIADVNSSIDALDADKTNGSGTAGYLTKWSGTKTLGDSNVYTDGTSVTVGATTLSERFEVAGPAGAIGRIAATDGGGSNRYALLLTSPSAAQAYARLESYKSGTGAGGKTLAINASLGGQVIINGTVPSSWTKFEVIGVAQAALYDKGGHVFNVKAYGATGDGTTDDTTAIGLAITAAAAISPRGVVFFPPGTYKTTGAHSLNGLDGLQIVGSGIGSTVIRLAHATNDLFSVGATVTSNLRISDMTITSDTVTRSAGWIFRVNNAYNGTGALKNSVFRNLEITKQFNGIAFEKFAFIEFNDSILWDAVGTAGVAVKFGQTTSTNINQGSEARCRNVKVYPALSGTARWATGFLIEDCDAVELEGCGAGGLYGDDLKIVGNSGGHAPANHFFANCIFDATDTGHCVNIAGPATPSRLKFVGCWFASAGAMTGVPNGRGVYGAVSLGAVEISACNFYNNRGTGLYLNGAASPVTVNGCTFEGNGVGAGASNNDAIYINTTLNSLGPVITGCQDLGSNGVSVRTGAGANRLVLVGNRWVSGTSYGIAPSVDASNGA